MNRQFLIRSHRALHGDRIPGGAGRLMRHLASALQDSGWSVDILCPSPETDTPLSNSDVSFKEFPYKTPQTPTQKMMQSVRGLQTFRQLVHEESYDIILDDVSHIPFYPAHFCCPDETVNALFLHTAFFGRARRYSGPVKGTVIDFIDRTLPLLNEPEIVCAGPSTEALIRRRLQYKKTAVLNPCIELSHFTYNFDPMSKRVLYLGRLSKRKNVSCLLNAWSEVEQNHPDYTLTVAGTGPEEQRLKEQCAELQLSNIEFRGFVDESEKNHLYENSLAFVLPSLMEGYVTTGLEALASGTPIVGADTYGIHDYVSDGDNGYLFKRDDPVSLASVLDRVFTAPEELRPLAERGRKVAEKHSYDVFREEANTLFEQLAV